MRFLWRLGIALAVIPARPGQITAAPVISHGGAANPTTENFGLWPNNGGITSGPVANDLGLAAWTITNTGAANRQAFYNQLGGTGGFDPGGSGLTLTQIDAINAHGFLMSLRARIVEGPTYTATGTRLFSVSSTLAGFNGHRYDIDLGTDGAGNTLVILPTNIGFDGVSFTATPFGSPLIIAGTDYHLYQLSYNHVTERATLFVDGVSMVTDYAGANVSGGATANNYGLAFGATNDATGNFALAELASGSLTLPADFDENSVVAAPDLELWRAGIGAAAGATHMQGDANADRAVDGADFLIWQQELGMSSSLLSNASVPEPTGAFLALLGLAVLPAVPRSR